MHGIPIFSGSDSIVLGTDGRWHLSGDEAAPGNWDIYQANGSGTRGWQDGQDISTDAAVQFAGVTSTDASTITVTAPTLEDGSSATGTDTTMATQWIATSFTASDNETMGDFELRVKCSVALTNPTATLTGYIYADDGGSPSKPTGAALATGSVVRFGSLATSYVVLSFGTTRALVSGTKYWLVAKYSATPTGGDIVFDSAVSADAGATSPDGSAWTSTNVLLYSIVRGTTGVSLTAISTNGHGIYGNSTNDYGVRGLSINSYGVYGSSTNSYGVYGSSTNNYGVRGASTNNYAVRGSSVNSYGIYGTSTNSVAIYAASTTNSSIYAYRNSHTATTAVADIVQDDAADTYAALRVQQDGSGDILSLYDGATLATRVLDGGHISVIDNVRVYFSTANDSYIEFGNNSMNLVANAVTATDTLNLTAGKINCAADVYPATDDTYYLGKNDDDTPFAWKGVILKDTTNGKYYRIEVINGVITATDLTD